MLETSQLAAMVGCSGDGVEILLVGLVVVGWGVVEDDVLKVEVGGVTTGFKLEELVLLTTLDVNVKTVEETEIDDVRAVDDGSVGRGSFIASTQYDFPTVNPPQSSVIDGFCKSC